MTSFYGRNTNNDRQFREPLLSTTSTMLHELRKLLIHTSKELIFAVCMPILLSISVTTSARVPETPLRGASRCRGIRAFRFLGGLTGRGITHPGGMKDTSTLSVLKYRNDYVYFGWRSAVASMTDIPTSLSSYYHRTPTPKDALPAPGACLLAPS